MNRTFGLYIFGFLAVALAVAFPSLPWLSPVTFLLVIPLGAIWIWKSQGRSLWDLGYRFSGGWFRHLAIGLLFGLAIPILFQAIQVLGGWIALTPRGEPIQDLASYLPTLLLRMVFIVAIEVTRHYPHQNRNALPATMISQRTYATTKYLFPQPRYTFGPTLPAEGSMILEIIMDAKKATMPTQTKTVPDIN